MTHEEVRNLYKPFLQNMNFAPNTINTLLHRYFLSFGEMGAVSFWKAVDGKDSDTKAMLLEGAQEKFQRRSGEAGRRTYIYIGFSAFSLHIQDESKQPTDSDSLLCC